MKCIFVKRRQQDILWKQTPSKLKIINHSTWWPLIWKKLYHFQYLQLRWPITNKTYTYTTWGAMKWAVILISCISGINHCFSWVPRNRFMCVETSYEHVLISKHVLLYSDTCTGQNRNLNFVLMFMKFPVIIASNHWF